MRVSKTLVVVLGVAAVLAAIPAYGATVGTLWLSEVGVVDSSVVGIHSPTYQLSAVAGVYELLIDHATGHAPTGVGIQISDFAAPHSNLFSSFCADPNHLSTSTPTLYEVKPLEDVFNTSALQVLRLKKLFANYSQGSMGDVPPVGWPGDSAANFQIALWEIVVDGAGTLDLNPGLPANFYLVPNSGFADANLWLSTLDSSADPTSAVGYQAPLLLYNTSNQTYAFANAGIGGSQPVPEPLTMFGAFLGLSSLGMYIRKRTRTA